VAKRREPPQNQPTKAPEQEQPPSIDRWVLVALVALLAVGVGLRLLLIGAVSPAFTGFNDTSWYVIAARDDVFLNAAVPGAYPWPAGYSAFLRFMHHFSGQLSFLVLFQHALGIGTALLLFAVVRRIVSAAWGLVPAAVVLFAGPQLFLEHAVMAEALFAFLIAALIYCALRAYDGTPLLWAYAAGLLAAAAATVRLSGLTLIPTVVIWLALAWRGPWRRRLLVAGLAALGAAFVIGAYLGEMKRETGYGGPGLTHAGHYGAPPGSGRPVDFTERLGSDLVRFWDSDLNLSNGGLHYQGFIDTLVRADHSDLVDDASSWFPTSTPRRDRGTYGFLRDYERHTRFEGLPFVLLFLLAVGGLPFARGRRLALGLLVLAVALSTVITPILFARFDARYVVPGYGPLAAAGAIGAALLWERATKRWGGLAGEGRRWALPRAKAQA
jgi:4-amino-4-deoxy-L-arabinose transferase-like glycosyltransferase